jgi:hypothetical protein
MEVEASETERFVICHSPEGAERDAHIRTQLDELIAGPDTLSTGRGARVGLQVGVDRGGQDR